MSSSMNGPVGKFTGLEPFFGEEKITKQTFLTKEFNLKLFLGKQTF